MNRGRSKAAAVNRVLDRLADQYGTPPRKRKRNPLDSLVATILSQNTTDENSERAFASLKRSFPAWKRVLAASDREVADAIRLGGLADQKAGRIRRILLRIQHDWGRISLAGLRNMTTDEAMDYLLSFRGVGKKTAACVLLFSMHRDVFPVDTHIFRVTGRLGWLPEKTTPDTAHDVLAKRIPQKRYYEAHIHLIAHGRNICRARRPHCEACPIAGDCAFIKKR